MAQIAQTKQGSATTLSSDESSSSGGEGETSCLASYARDVLHGISQVCFFTNAYSGVIFGISVLLADPAAGLCGLAGGMAATGMGSCLPLPHLRREGMLGYNGVLVGCALPIFVPNLLLCMACSVVAGGISSLLFWGLGKILKPQLTLSFNLTTILTLALLKWWGQTPRLEPGDDLVLLDVLSLVEATLNGMAQIFLVTSPWTGILVILGICIYSPWAAFTSLSGSFTGTLLALAYGAYATEVQAGIWGFNGALVALWSTLHLDPSLSRLAMALLAPISAALATCIFAELEKCDALTHGWVRRCFTVPCALVALTLVLVKHGLHWLPAREPGKEKESGAQREDPVVPMAEP